LRPRRAGRPRRWGRRRARARCGPRRGPGPSRLRVRSCRRASWSKETSVVSRVSLQRTLRSRLHPALLLSLAALAAPAAAWADGVPNDPGKGTTPFGWQQIQWNFVGPFGVNAQQAWNNVATVGHPGGKGTVVAVLDTGVAYANRGRYRRSPDFAA